MFARVVLLASAAALTSGVTWGQSGNSRPPNTVEVVLEQYVDSNWQRVDPRTVFRPKDEVRFQFTSSTDGFLYVLNRTNAGQYLWIYPTAEAGTDNRVRAGERYTIPSTAGAFAIPDTPGFDVVYWMLSPTELKDLSLPPAESGRKSTLIPRCNEGDLRTRGNCLDNSAGAKPADKSVLPKPMAGTSPLAPRDIKMERKPDSSHIRFAGMNDRALVYEYWIAHR